MGERSLASLYPRRVRALTWSPGGSDLELADVSDLHPDACEVLVDVACVYVHRDEVVGSAAPGGPRPGAACAGVIRAVGDSVRGWRVGDRVCALLDDGGCADLALAPANRLLPVPAHVALPDAAGLAFSLCASWWGLVVVGQLATGDVILIEGAADCVPATAIQLGRALGARVLASAPGPDHVAACLQLGADIGIDSDSDDLPTRVRECTGDRGVDLVLDAGGRGRVERLAEVIAPGGRMVLSAMPARARDDVLAEVARRAWPWVVDGQVRPLIRTRVGMAEAAQLRALLTEDPRAGGALVLVSAVPMRAAAAARSGTGDAAADIPSRSAVEVAPGAVGSESGYWLRGRALEVFVTAHHRVRVLVLRRPGGMNLVSHTGALTDGLRCWVMTPGDDPDERDEVASLAGRMEPLDGALRLTTGISAILALSLEWTVSIDVHRPLLVVEHVVRNHGPDPRELAIWPVIGIAPPARLILPLGAASGQDRDARPVYHFPWSVLGDDRIGTGPEHVEVEITGTRGSAHIKLGVHAASGTGGALARGSALVSSTPFEPAGRYPEGGPNLTVYASPAQDGAAIGELENVGALHVLPPGRSLSLRQSISIQDEADSAFLRGIRHPRAHRAP